MKELRCSSAICHPPIIVSAVLVLLVIVAASAIAPKSAFATGDNEPPMAELGLTTTSAIDMVASDAVSVSLPSIKRLSGATRYDTMAEIVAEGYLSSSEWAIIATGENFPDALAASALAGAKRCPIILTSGKSLSAQASSMLQKLKVKNAYIMGGASAVNENVATAIEWLGISINRVYGSDRVSTSLAVMKELQEIGKASNTVIVATSKGFAAALSIGPWSYASASPILLTQSDGMLTNVEVPAIRPSSHVKRILVIGGYSAVSSVESQLPGYQVTRLSGGDRYATSAMVAEWSVANGLSWARPCVATGSNFPDALAGAALAGMNASPLLLVNRGVEATVTLLKANRTEMPSIAVLGGKNAVSDSVMQILPGKNTPDEAYDAFECVVRDEAASVTNSAYYHSAYYCYADICGDSTDELLCTKKNAMGSGWTISMYAYEAGALKELCSDMGYYGDQEHRFYKAADAYVLRTGGHGHEGYSYFKLVDGEYEGVASRGRQSAEFGGYDGPWAYYGRDALSGSISEAAFKNLIGGLEKGNAVIVPSSYCWLEMTL